MAGSFSSGYSPSPPPADKDINSPPPIHFPHTMPRPTQKRRSVGRAKQVIRDDDDELESEQDAPPRLSARRSNIATLNDNDTEMDDPDEGDEDEGQIHLRVGGEKDSLRPSASASNVPSSNNSEDGDGRSPSKRTLKVRLRMTHTNSSSSSVVAVPTMEEDELEEDEEEGAGGERDEDDDEDDSSDEEELLPSRQPKAPAVMTARQAALAGVGNTPDGAAVTHMSLDELLQTNRRKGPQKTEQEILAKKHEAAKRRKMALIQKTQDDKKDAVDRLLKRQAPRPRAKRFESGTSTPALVIHSGRETPAGGAGAAGEDDTRSNSEDTTTGASTDANLVAFAPPPSTFRWISTSRGNTGGGKPVAMMDGDDGAEKMDIVEDKPDAGPDPLTTSTAEGPVSNVQSSATTGPPDPSATTAPPKPSKPTSGPPPALAFSFSIPSSLLPAQPVSHEQTPLPAAPATPTCAVSGCTNVRKYRVVVVPSGKKSLSDTLNVGACGLDHFRMLKAAASSGLAV